MAGLSRHVPLTRHFYLRTVRSARTPHNPHSATPDGYHAERVWTIPVSLATTKGMISFPRGTEMFQFPRCPPRTLCIQVRVTEDQLGRVSPFGYLRITVFYQLPAAFRR
jgi:hypothetical protein